MKIREEIIGEKKVKRGREGACSTSYPSGNQVDGLPLVAVLKTKSRRPRTQILLTMRNMFLSVIAWRSVLGNSRFNLSYLLRLLIKVARPQNDRAISEFYRF